MVGSLLKVRWNLDGFVAGQLWESPTTIGTWGEAFHQNRLRDSKNVGKWRKKAGDFGIITTAERKIFLQKLHKKWWLLSQIKGYTNPTSPLGELFALSTTKSAWTGGAYFNSFSDGRHSGKWTKKAWYFGIVTITERKSFF